MAARKEFPVKVRRVAVTNKKTGVKYIEERRYQYDPAKGYNVLLSSRRTGEKMALLDFWGNWGSPCHQTQPRNKERVGSCIVGIATTLTIGATRHDDFTPRGLPSTTFSRPA